MEFELSFKNKRVRMWFYLVIPTVLISILLIFLLPRQYHVVLTFLPAVSVIIFYGWVLYDKRKHR